MEQLREKKNTLDPKAYLRKVQEEGFDDEKDLENFYKQTLKTLRKARERDLGVDEAAEKVRHTSINLIETDATCSRTSQNSRLLIFPMCN